MAAAVGKPKGAFYDEACGSLRTGAPGTYDAHLRMGALWYNCMSMTLVDVSRWPQAQQQQLCCCSGHMLKRYWPVCDQNHSFSRRRVVWCHLVQGATRAQVDIEGAEWAVLDALARAKEPLAFTQLLARP